DLLQHGVEDDLHVGDLPILTSGLAAETADRERSGPWRLAGRGEVVPAAGDGGHQIDQGGELFGEVGFGPADGVGAVVVLAGHGDGGVGGGPEVAGRFEVLRERHVPDAPSRLPGVAADGRGGEVEGPVGDPGVDVDAAVVVGRVVVVGEIGVAAHRAGLAVE